ncbi:MAG: hypothetical protein AAGA54_00970 [Myxococcota bacterium]
MKPSLEAAAPEEPVVTEPAPSMALVRAEHQHPMTEVVLSPSGASALTLDAQGGVRLWRDVTADDVPIELPVEEPLWMSVAESEDGLRVAFVDTAGGSFVATVTFSEEGVSWRPAFEMPPTDPMFELHVLEGGARILALGVDHRVRLYDARGTTLATLDEHGVIPWQLRVGTDAQGKPVAAAVQFSPVRIQRLSLDEDRLALVGEAHTIGIDQSPNRNDIAMSPDGSYVTAMQKTDPKRGRFELEIIDLQDGSRRMLVGESDTLFRPRVHPLHEAILAETGSGQALRLSLDEAVPWTPGADRALLEPAAATTVPLSGSDDDSMMHATLQRGRHASARGDTLFVQSIDRQTKVERRPAPFVPVAAALDHAGTTVAWATETSIELEGPGGRTSLAASGEPIVVIGFGHEDTLVTVDAKGTAQIRTRASGEVLDEAALTVSWGVLDHGWRVTATGGTVVLGDDKPSAPLQVLHVEGTHFGAREAVATGKRASWPEGGKPRRVDSADWMTAMGLDLDALEIPPEALRTVRPNADDSLVIVHQARRFQGFDRARGVWKRGEAGVLTGVDAKTSKRLWSRAVDRVEDLAWSGDGSRFVYVDGTGGYVCDAATGETLSQR